MAEDVARALEDHAIPFITTTAESEDSAGSDAKFEVSPGAAAALKMPASLSCTLSLLFFCFVLVFVFFHPVCHCFLTLCLSVIACHWLPVTACLPLSDIVLSAIVLHCSVRHSCLSLSAVTSVLSSIVRLFVSPPLRHVRVADCR